MAGENICADIFGEWLTPRHEETPVLELDICCVVKNENDKEEVRSLLNEESSRLYGELGVKLAPVLFTVSEYGR